MSPHAHSQLVGWGGRDGCRVVPAPTAMPASIQDKNDNAIRDRCYSAGLRTDLITTNGIAGSQSHPSIASFLVAGTAREIDNLKQSFLVFVLNRHKKM